MAGGEVTPLHIWSVRADEPADEAVLSDDERARAATLQRIDDRTAYIAVHVALRRVLGQLTGRPPGELRFTRICEHCGDPGHGRPVLADGGPSFSVSRAGPVALIAVLDGPAVGVDIEALNQPATWEAVKEDFFTAAERKAFTPPRAAQWWARKEAVAKALGLGMAMPFGETDVRGDREWVQVRAVGARPIVRDLHVPGAPGYAAAVALREPPPRALVIES